jgi:hypothetical protein
MDTSNINERAEKLLKMFEDMDQRKLTELVTVMRHEYAYFNRKEK